MNKAFEKIIEQLEKQKDFYNSDSDWDLANYSAYSDTIEIANQVASEYFKENYFNLDNAKLHDCPKCGEKATHRVNKKGSWACGCFKCELFKSSYDHVKAIQAWEDYCGEYNGGWIPVSSGKLPELGQEVIITDEDGYVRYGIYYGFMNPESTEPSFHKWDDELWNCFVFKPVAWRENLEPYKAESEDNA